jgi:regulator of replication initiation timing
VNNNAKRILIKSCSKVKDDFGEKSRLEAKDIAVRYKMREANFDQQIQEVSEIRKKLKTETESANNVRLKISELRGKLSTEEALATK